MKKKNKNTEEVIAETPAAEENIFAAEAPVNNPFADEPAEAANPFADAPVAAADAPSEAPGMFEAAPASESNMFGDESDESATPKKKKKRIGLRIGLCISAVLLAGAAAATPWLLVKIGDTKLSAGDHKAADTLYKYCFGLFGSDQRRIVTAAITSMKEGGIESGIEALLNAGIPVDINYDLNGGEFINTSRKAKVSLTNSAEFGSLYKARKDYYTFTNWDLVDYSYAPEFESPVFRIDLKAAFSLTNYKISYSGLFSDTVENPQEYNYETKTITLKSPKRAGYSFVSWKGTDIANEATTVVIPQGSHGERAYIANWKANEYVVTMNPDVECEIENPITVTFDTEYALPAIEKRGYTHMGWSDGKNTYFNGVWSVPNDANVDPVWDLNNYKLTYDLGGGTLAEENPATYTVLSEDIAIHEPTRFGYAFQGWSCNEAAAAKDIVIKNDSIGDIDFKAIWKGNPHTLSLDAAGGSVSPTVVNVVFGSDFTIPTPYRTGYAFQGWFNGSTQMTAGVWDKDEDLNAAAKWTANKYKVSLDANGGNSSGSSFTATYDASYSLPSATRFGYSFLGWYNGNTQVANSGTWKTASDTTLYAWWLGNPHVVSLNANGGTVNSSKVNVVFGDEYSLPTPKKKGHSFDGWFNYSTEFPAYGTWDKDSDLSLTAKWTVNTYKARLDVADGSVSSSTISCKYDSWYSLPTPTRTGYDFVGWYNEYEGRNMSSYGTWVWDSNIDVTALWDARDYTVSFNANGGSVSSSRMTVTYGKSYRLPTPTRTGYEFVGWYDGSRKVANSGKWNRAESVYLTAKWEVATYKLSFDSNGGSNESSQTVQYGDYFTLPTPTRTGYSFAGWYYGSSKISGSYLTYKWDSNVTLEAQWSANTYSIRLDANGGSSSSSQVYVSYGSSYSLPTPTRSGYKFVGWYYGSTKYSNSGTWRETQSITLTARWEQTTTSSSSSSSSSSGSSTVRLVRDSEGNYSYVYGS